MSRRLVETLCAAAFAGALIHTVAAPAGAQAARHDALVLMMGADTFAVENITRSATALEGELVGRATGRMVYRLALGPAGSVGELTLRAWMPGRTGDDAPMQEARVTFAGDSAFVRVTSAAGDRVERIATRPGALPYLNPSFGLLEPILARSRASGGSMAVVPLFFLQGGQTLEATVTWVTADSVTIAIAGALMHAVVDADGSIRHAAVPAQHLAVTRAPGVHLPPAGIGPPDYSAPADAPYTAEQAAVPTPAGHTLAGTLTRPTGTGLAPAVVMITGSGAQDRDQSLPTLPGYRPFREIADALSRRGIAVLRLDDRGFGESSGDFAAATSADLADDIRAALAWLRARDDIDAARLGLVGHSEGGIIAPMIAASDTTLAAIVIVAGPSRTGRQIIAFQQRYAIERSPAFDEATRDSAYAAAQAQIEELAAGSPWIRFFLDHDPLPVARQVRHTPVLILHGETDMQVPVEQAAELAAEFGRGGNRDVTVRTLPDVNHLLIRDADGSPAAYATLTERHIAPEVLEALVEWLAVRLR